MEHIYNEQTDGSLIPCHIGIARGHTYFFNWDSNLKEWVRGEKIDEHLNKMYKNPCVKTTYGS